MITLFHCMSARSFRPLWTLEALGLPYELKMQPFPPRVHAREFLAINPLGTVPAFFDGEVRMTESVAICHYLATRDGTHSLAIEVSDPEYGNFLNWLYFGEATLTFPQTLVLRYGRLESAERRQPQVEEDYRRWFLARLKGIEPVLRERDFLCGQRFTVADISVGYALMLASYLGLSERFPASVQAYWHRLQEGQAYQQALAAQLQAACAQDIPTMASPLVST